jgi:hypothetical protein
MVFRGPAAWAEPREAVWERDMPRGLARDDEWPEVLLRADLAAEKHPRPVRSVPVVLKEAA